NVAVNTDARVPWSAVRQVGFAGLRCRQHVWRTWLARARLTAVIVLHGVLSGNASRNSSACQGCSANTEPQTAISDDHANLLVKSGAIIDGQRQETRRFYCRIIAGAGNDSVNWGCA